jgi:hypothetical protein
VPTLAVLLASATGCADRQRGATTSPALAAAPQTRAHHLDGPITTLVERLGDDCVEWEVPERCYAMTQVREDGPPACQGACPPVRPLPLSAVLAICRGQIVQLRACEDDAPAPSDPATLPDDHPPDAGR